jgi:hypothetical protein
LHLSSDVQIRAKNRDPSQCIRPGRRTLGSSNQTVGAQARPRGVVYGVRMRSHVAGAEKGPGHGVYRDRPDGFVIGLVVEIEGETAASVGFG